MKKFVIVMLAAVTLLVVCGACNMQVVDTTWSYEKGIITLPNGDVVEGKVETWREYSDSDMLQVKIDGKQYLTHSVNVVLIAE